MDIETTRALREELDHLAAWVDREMQPGDQASARLLEQIAKQRADLGRGRRACRPRPSGAEP